MERICIARTAGEFADRAWAEPVLQRALQTQQMEISPYDVAVEVRARYAGMILQMAVATDPWQHYQSLSDQRLAKFLLELAANISETLPLESAKTNS